MLNRFTEPILVTRPLLPDLTKVNNQLEEVWQSHWITNNGPKSKELENSLKDYLEAENVSLFNNGTLALLLGLKALGIKGEVITTPFTFPATTEVLDWLGITPVFCDIDPDTLCIDANKIEGLITDKTTAILPVHVFGNFCDVITIQEIADKYKLKIIYDGAHVFGSKLNNKSISSYGDMTMFSFHATKLFNTIEGGAVVFKNDRLKEKLNQLKNFGLNQNGEVERSGLNAKLNEIQASVGLEVLNIVPEERVQRERVRLLYEENLKDIPGIRIITKNKGVESSYQYFTIEIEEESFGISRDKLFDKLKEFNIFTRKYFHPLCSSFRWYKHLESTHHLPVAEETVQKVLAMPYYGELSNDDVYKICEVIKYIHERSLT
ncbi:DegT/DnrJ/EryC1/StrS family aminotransferase [Aquibacillus sediminis]|uniref:DegT/DnrJ/EryC1/StrS family aminotransferase n=1 Tax=Aquibacillus sediminis TaxID=2574734 RepID=UPI0011098011|nr:DegT/DnrJ/EryC1/StrS family aminotransferase [Aquibacillus sediminis]